MLSYNDIRRRLQRCLKHPVRDCDWECLLEEGRIDDYLDKPDEIECLADEVLRRERHYPSGLDGLRTNAQTIEARSTPSDEVSTGALLRPEEAHRAKVYSEYVASLAANIPDVQYVRDLFTGGSLVDAPTAVRCLRSSAAALLDTWTFGELDIPVVGHTAEIAAPPRHLRLEPAGKVVPLPVHNPSALEQLQYFDQGEVKSVRYAPYSPIGDLARVTRYLMNEFAWQEPAAVAFVLTGKTPYVGPIQVSIQWRKSWVERATVTVQVEPWVSVETVETAYRTALKQLPKGEKKLRQLGGRPLDALSFYLNRCRDGVRPRLASSQFVADWNSKHPDRQYPDRSGLARDIRRIADQLHWPGYRHWGNKPATAVDSQTDSQPSGGNASNAE